MARLLTAIALAIATLGASAQTPARCGAERWPVKTLAAGAVRKAMQVATVAELTALSAPSKKELLGFSTIRLPAEQVMYVIDAEITGYKRESDGDFHIVIAQGPQHMIVEVPSPECVRDRALQQSFAEVRSQFEQHVGHATAIFKRVKQPVRARFSGYGFFDFIHGQTGVAPNGFELHPVMAIDYANEPTQGRTKR